MRTNLNYTTKQPFMWVGLPTIGFAVATIALCSIGWFSGEIGYSVAGLFSSLGIADWSA